MGFYNNVPGTVQADGTVRHDVASSTSAVIMLKNVKDKEAAWEFMKWWTEKETQVRFGREMEALMGEAARYPTANVEALEELPWPVKDYQNYSGTVEMGERDSASAGWLFHQQAS